MQAPVPFAWSVVFLSFHRLRPFEVSRGPGSARWTGSGRFPEGGVWAAESEPGGGDQPVPQWDVLTPLPPRAPSPDTGLYPRGPHLHRQIHSRAVPECKGTVLHPFYSFRFLWSLVISSLMDSLDYCECQPNFTAYFLPFKGDCGFVYAKRGLNTVTEIAHFYQSPKFFKLNLFASDNSIKGADEKKNFNSNSPHLFVS